MNTKQRLIIAQQQRYSTKNTTARGLRSARKKTAIKNVFECANDARYNSAQNYADKRQQHVSRVCEKRILQHAAGQSAVIAISRNCYKTAPFPARKKNKTSGDAGVARVREVFFKYRGRWSGKSGSTMYADYSINAINHNAYVITYSDQSQHTLKLLSLRNGTHAYSLDSVVHYVPPPAYNIGVIAHRSAIRVLRKHLDNTLYSVRLDRDTRCDIIVTELATAEEYHVDTHRFYSTDHVARELRNMTTAFNRRREKLELLKIESTTLQKIWVSIEDSIKAGNCGVGTRSFVDVIRKKIGEIGAIRADIMLAIRDDVYTRRAVAAAAKRYQLA